jgi:5-methylcytosine-specific restriction protein A
MPWKPRPPGADARARAKRERYDNPEWRRLRAQVLAQWRAEYGNWCPGYNVPAHAASDLTVDHVAAGSLEAGVAVLCRRCNGSKGNR